MNMNQIIDMLKSIGKEFEIDYAINRIYKYLGNNNNKVIIAASTIYFEFDESGILLDMWSIE